MPSAFHSCTCDECVSCCEKTPGWLSPNDVRRLARHLKVEPPTLFRTHLIWDHWVGCPYGCDDECAHGTPEIPAPAARSDTPGEHVEWAYPFSANPCLQLVDRRCAIHPAKPRECWWALGCQKGNVNSPRRRIARAWSRSAARQFRHYLQNGEERST